MILILKIYFDSVFYKINATLKVWFSKGIDFFGPSYLL